MIKRMQDEANKQALKSSVKDEPAFVVGWDRCLGVLIPEIQKKVLKHAEKELKALKNMDVNPLDPEKKVHYETKVATCKEIYALLEKYLVEEDEE